jgi:hypothetical protein
MSDFKIRRQNPLSVVALERLYLKADYKTIVREGDPEAAHLLAAAGSEIPQKLAKRLGLLDEPAAKTISPEDIASRSTRPAGATIVRTDKK